MDLAREIINGGDSYQIVGSEGSIVSLLGGKIDHTLQELFFALSNLKRNAGHLGGYSVGQHSCLVCDMTESYGGLGHDFHEAWTIDMPTPLKNTLNLIGNNVWQTFEFDFAKRIRSYWGIPNPMPPAVKAADSLAFRIELGTLASNRSKSAYMKLGYEPVYQSKWSQFDIWSPDKTQAELHSRFNKYGPSGRRK